MVSEAGPKYLLGILSTLLFLATIIAALATPLEVKAWFDTPESSLAYLHVETPQEALCKYDVLSKPYLEMSQTFEQTGDRVHEQRVVVRDTTTVYIGCADLYGRTYEITHIQLYAPDRNALTGHVVEEASPPDSSRPFFPYLVGVTLVATTLAYAARKKSPARNPTQAYRTLLPFSAVPRNPNYPTLSTSLIRDLLHRAHSAIDRQHFQESLTQYKYLLHLLDTHRIPRENGTERVPQQLHDLYSKLQLYQQLHQAHTYWVHNNRTSLRQTLRNIQLTYNQLRHTPPNPLLQNAYKSYTFYERFLRHAK